jgi:hypothetical protein
LKNCGAHSLLCAAVVAPKRTSAANANVWSQESRAMRFSQGWSLKIKSTEGYAIRSAAQNVVAIEVLVGE